MSVVIRTPRTSRLSKLIDSAGGASVGVALARARRNLARLEPRSLEVVKGHVAELLALAPPAGSDDVFPKMEAAYRAAVGVLDAAGPFERGDLCAAAASLCDLIDAAGQDGFDWRIVQVHARAIELMLTLPAGAADQRKRVLEGLADVRARKLPPQAT
ncbi:MAG: chemotaxis protein CheE [Pseudomonadota bacterium]